MRDTSIIASGGQVGKEWQSRVVKAAFVVYFALEQAIVYAMMRVPEKKYRVCLIEFVSLYP